MSYLTAQQKQIRKDLFDKGVIAFHPMMGYEDKDTGEMVFNDVSWPEELTHAGSDHVFAYIQPCDQGPLEKDPILDYVLRKKYNEDEFKLFLRHCHTIYYVDGHGEAYLIYAAYEDDVYNAILNGDPAW